MDCKKNLTLTFVITFSLLNRLRSASDMFQKRFPPGCKSLRSTKYCRTAEICSLLSEDPLIFRGKSACARKFICTVYYMLLRMGRLDQRHRNATVMWATPVNNGKLSYGGLGMSASTIKRRLYKVFVTTSIHTLKRALFIGVAHITTAFLCL